MFNILKKQKKAGKGGLSLLKLSLLLGFVNSVSAAEEANTSALTVVPSQCVALTQGQKCYVDAKVSWTLPTKGNYCLYSSQQDAPLICWQQKNTGSLSKELASDKNIVFKLKSEQKKTVATSQLKVTWVHQKKGQPRMWWRVF